MSAIRCLNPKAEVAKAAQALQVNIMGARGLQDAIKTNLGPRGTMKMLVSGAGDIKITKDGNVLLHEMQIQHPTASLVARVATAQDDATGDGTTSTVLLIGELLKQADTYVSEGLHPRIIKEGFDLAKDRTLALLDRYMLKAENGVDVPRDVLTGVARTSLRTKVHQELADTLTEQVVDAVLAVKPADGGDIDLHMVEIMEMQHQTDMDTRLVRGIVMDHGVRHPDMPKHVENAYILVTNVSFEYEKTEVNSSFFYKTSSEREKMVAAERAFIDARVAKVIALKRRVIDDAPDGKGRSFVLINQKGIDPFSLDALAKEGIVALRRAKRRNMERIPLMCGGEAVNSVDDLTPDVLGHAGKFYEHVLGEEKFTFLEDCAKPRSVTLLMKGPNKHTLVQIKDAIHDGLRAVKNALDDKAVVPGAGAFELAAYDDLMALKSSTTGRTRLGIQAFADALLIIPKTLAQNSGHDQQETIVRLMEAFDGCAAKKSADVGAKGLVGLDVKTGEAMCPADQGIFDNVCVKRQVINSSAMISSNLLLVDEIMRAGLSSMKG